MNPLKSLMNKLTKSNDSVGGFTKFIRVPVQQAGVPVTHDSALTYSAIWRSINLISDSIAGLPWGVNERSINVNGRKESKPLIGHPLSNMLDLAPNDEMDAYAWRQTMIAWALSWGNGYSEIDRDGAGRPGALWTIEPNRVNPDRDQSGRLVYDISNGSAANTVLRPDQMFHLKGLGFDGLVGYSIIGYAAKTIGMGLACEQYGASFYENGSQASGVFTHPGQLGDEALKHLRESIDGTHQGVRKSHKNMILEEGMKWDQITIPQDDAQFIESRKFQITEVARWYGVPPHKLMEMEQATFSNIEEQNIEFTTDGLLPWIKRLEIEANIKLVARRNRGKVVTKLKLNALLRGDSGARSVYYKEMRDMGALNANEIREFEDMNPIGPEGEKYLVQLNLTTLDKIGEDEPETGNTVTDDDDTTTGMALIENTVDRILRREHHRAIADLKNHANDIKQFTSRINDFYKQHHEYITNELSPVINHLGLKVDLSAFAWDHIDQSTTELMNAFDNGFDETPFTRTAQDIARQLVGI